VAARQQALDAAPDPGFDPEAWRRARQAADARQEAALHLAALERRSPRPTPSAAWPSRPWPGPTRPTPAPPPSTPRRPPSARPTPSWPRPGAAEGGHRPRHRRPRRRSAAAQALAGAARLAEARQAALDAGRAQHERVAGLEEEAAYLQKLVDLVAGFRLHLVSRLGRRLSVESAALFAELTDHEYQDLVVDPEDYAIRIADAGTEYELSRFSGSENDLASLSLRVAVSLVIAESAGELGLLVLDEVLGALDRERRERMLEALTRLQGRFRQVLLVTHNDEVKDLLRRRSRSARAPTAPRWRPCAAEPGRPGALASLRSGIGYPILRRPVCTPRVPPRGLGNNRQPDALSQRHARNEKENTLWLKLRKRRRGRSRPLWKS
jgi:hypothetical protein